MQDDLSITSGVQKPLWIPQGLPVEFPALVHNTEADVCVIGGGIAGLSTAYLLAAEGKKVIVLEDGHIGSGETGRTSAHLSNALDDRYSHLEKLHGLEGARLAAESHAAAINRIDLIARTEHIDCEFEWVDGYLFAHSEKDHDLLTQELEAAHRAGLNDVTWAPRAPWSFFNTGACLRFPQQAQFHPMKYLRGLTRAFVQRGGLIFEQTHVTGIEGGPTVRISTKQGSIVIAGAAVVATNVPIHQKASVHVKQAAYRSYVIAARIPQDQIEKALYWDTADPYHYLRLEVTDPLLDPLLIIGGEDHKTGQPAADSPYQKLETWARQRFPHLEGVEYHWSGQIIEPVDGLAYIGHHPLDEDNIYLVTGDSGNGLTHGTVAGMLLTDLIHDRPNPWAALYAPGRVHLMATGTFLKENINVAVQYADWLTENTHMQLQALPPGNAAIIKDADHHIAAYRDPEGRLMTCSAVCPHLGCLVHWNNSEKTWDCPCHGSRFDTEGHVLNGPANSDLPEITAQSTLKSHV